MSDFNDGVDGKLAFRMRKVNPDQFLTLVKMHLSFELDLNAEDSDGINEKARLKKRGLLSFAKKSKSLINMEKSEGITLSEDGINHVMQLIEYLSKEQNIAQEGIFRRTGKLTRQQDLKIAMFRGLSLDFDDGRFSVHDCASVLKGFLAELSEPLLTDSHYPAYCQIAELCSLDVTKTAPNDQARLLSSLQLLLLLLPFLNRILLKAILTLLNKTASYELSNKMNSNTLATLFTPHLLCPRKLSPEALHINSQNLSCLVAFMIRKGVELFEIPPKLATDIRAYWIEQERKLLSPKKTDLNESVSDNGTTATSGSSTAHTVFSFVDRNLTAKANSTQNQTQAALAQLYAHIQAMPESAKKRRLVKQFNKENGQGTPRHIKPTTNCKPTKSLGDSIKKHIFQKKILGQKKFNTAECNNRITRSSSEENIFESTKLAEDCSLLPSRMLLSKSNDELTSTENCCCNNATGNNLDLLLRDKRVNSSSSSSLKNETLAMSRCDTQSKLVGDRSDVNAESDDKNTQRDDEAEESLDSVRNNFWTGSIRNTNVNTSISDDGRSDAKLTRKISEPHDMYFTCNNAVNVDCNNLLVTDGGGNFVRRQTSSESMLASMPNAIQIARSKTRASNVESSSSSSSSSSVIISSTSDEPYPYGSSSCAHSLSPIVRTRFKNIYSVHTSTPSSLLRQRRSLVATGGTSDYIFTPSANNDKSMSPITQSATKMTKAMQETMMTPRSRKPVMMVNSTSNLCNLVTVDNNAHISNVVDTVGAINNCASILEESQTYNTSTAVDNVSSQRINDTIEETAEMHRALDTRLARHTVHRACTQHVVDNCCCACTQQVQQSFMSVTSTFKEYLLSRSVLTASPVDLSFTSRTGDFEQSESDLNILSNDDDDDTVSDLSLLHRLPAVDGANQPTESSDTSGIASVSTNSANSTEKLVDIVSPRKRGTSLQRNDSKKSAKESLVRKSSRDLKELMKHGPRNESTHVDENMQESFQETSF